MKILRDLFRRGAEFDDLKAEIRAHLDEKIAGLVAAGMPRAEAEQAARRAFGNVTSVEEAGRDVWRMPRMLLAIGRKGQRRAVAMKAPPTASRLLESFEGLRTP